jgi:hypothetical protein
MSMTSQEIRQRFLDYMVCLKNSVEGSKLCS